MLDVIWHFDQDFKLQERPIIAANGKGDEDFRQLADITTAPVLTAEDRFNDIVLGGQHVRSDSENSGVRMHCGFRFLSGTTSDPLGNPRARYGEL